MWYISTAEANTYLWTSWQDTLVGVIIEIATNLVNRICWVETFTSWTMTNESYDYNWVWPYYFTRVPVNSITHINWTSTTLVEWTDYILRWQRVEFAPNISFNWDTIWNKVKFTYTYWYANIPNDIKDATRILVSELWRKKDSEGISSRTQWDLSVTFNSVAEKETERKVKSLLAKYILPRVFA